MNAVPLSLKETISVATEMSVNQLFNVGGFKNGKFVMD